MMRREFSRVISGGCLVVTPEIDHLCSQRHNEGDECHQPSLQAARRADADERPHQESEIEATDVHEQTLQDVRVPPQMRASHRTGFVEMRVWALQSLASATLQRQPAPATNAS